MAYQLLCCRNLNLCTVIQVQNQYVTFKQSFLDMTKYLKKLPKIVVGVPVVGRFSLSIELQTTRFSSNLARVQFSDAEHAAIHSRCDAPPNVPFGTKGLPTKTGTSLWPFVQVALDRKQNARFWNTLIISRIWIQGRFYCQTSQRLKHFRVLTSTAAVLF